MNFKDISIGIDIEETSRFKEKNIAFYENIFTPNEIEYCLSKNFPEQHFAVRFCAKEAFVKAISFFDYKNITLKEIEIYHDKNGCPQISFSKDDTIFSCKVSLSHSKKNAIAIVLIKKIRNLEK